MSTFEESNRAHRSREVDRLIEQIAELDPDEGRLRVLSRLLTEGLLDGDEELLQSARKQLERLGRTGPRDGAVIDESARMRGWLGALSDVTGSALNRVGQHLPSGVAPNSRAHEFLAAVKDRPRASNDEIAAAIGATITHVSHLGATVAQAGLAQKRRHGRRNAWDLTPRGQRMLVEWGPADTSPDDVRLERNKQLVRSFITEVINGGRLDRLGDFVAENFVDHSASAGGVQGPAALREQLVTVRRSFEDLRSEEQDMIAEGDRVVYRGRLFGLTSLAGRRDPDGAPEIRIVRVEHDKLAEAWGLVDPLPMQSLLSPLVSNAALRSAIDDFASPQRQRIYAAAHEHEQKLWHEAGLALKSPTTVVAGVGRGRARGRRRRRYEQMKYGMAFEEQPQTKLTAFARIRDLYAVLFAGQEEREAAASADASVPEFQRLKW
jgi:predicted ester cyclase